MVEISCEMNEKANFDYFMFVQKKSMRIFTIMGIFSFVFAALYLLDCIISYNPQELYEDIAVVAVLIMIGLLFVFGFKYLLINAFHKTYKTNKFLCSNPVYTYQFNENNYKLLITSRLGMEECTYSYEMINHVVETEEYFYIALASNSAYVVIKSSADADIISQISDLLRNKLGQKYIVSINHKKKQN